MPHQQIADMSIVSIVKCNTYERDTAQRAVRQAMELACALDIISSGKHVLLKPNLLSTRKPEDAVTTHPEIVRATAEICLERGCSVSVGDSPPFAGQNPERYARLCETTGIASVARELNIALVRFEDGSSKIEHPTGRFYKSFDIAQAVLDADIIINISKLKTHGLTTFTGAVKNVFGCIPGIRKGLFHVQAEEDREVFAQMLVDLYGALAPAINVMDAVVAMDGEGPNAGSPKHIGTILASTDGVALDAASCEMVGIEPMSIETTKLAHEQGLGCGDLACIELRGEAMDNVRIADFILSSGRRQWADIPTPIRRILRRQIIAYPVISAAECVGCGDCVEACPVNAIAPGRPPSIDLHKCIRCYCCHEVCNYSAARLRRGWLGSLLLGGREKN